VVLSGEEALEKLTPIASSVLMDCQMPSRWLRHDQPLRQWETEKPAFRARHHRFDRQCAHGDAEKCYAAGMDRYLEPLRREL